MSNFEIDGFDLGQDFKPYIIAEIGVNHEGSIDKAKELILLAKQAGAHAAKFQSYKASKLASKYSPSYWDTSKETTKSQHELFKKYDRFEPEDYQLLAAFCEKNEIDFISTPFDNDSVDFLDPLVKFFKIASADITNLPLIRKCAKTKKPLVMSTGASNFEEIEFAINEAQKAGATQIALLHCVLNYPTKEENASLGLIKELQSRFPEFVIGYSDHVVPDDSLSALLLAVQYGAQILEKHFTHDKTLPGNDHYHSMDVHDLAHFTNKLKIYELMSKAEMSKNSLANEESARVNARRSIVADVDIKAGDVLSEDNLICKRPASGISPVYWDDVIGAVALKDIGEDEALTWDMVKKDI